MRVFVSSTVYDLLDIRSELEAELKLLGLIPVISDRGMTEFQAVPDRNSIDACLVNLRQSEIAIFVLDKRYGPSLKAAGFDDLSATHLEYRTACEAGIPILFYVRDRLEADYCYWEREKDNDKRSDLSFAWVRETRDQRIFELLQQHRRLDKNADGSNWFWTFRDSVELKQLIARDLRIPASRARLESMLRTGDVPAAAVAIDDSEHPIEHGGLVLTVRNVGTRPLINLEWRFVYTAEDQSPFYKEPVEDKPDPWHQQESISWLAAGDAAEFLIVSDIVNCRDRFNIQVQYQTTTGETITDHLQVGVSSPTFFGNVRRFSQDPHGNNKFRVRLASRIFAPANGQSDLFRIEEP